MLVPLQSEDATGRIDARCASREVSDAFTARYAKRFTHDSVLSSRCVVVLVYLF